MFSEKIPARQLNGWLFVAMTPVLIQYLGGTNWLWIVLFGAVCLLLNWIVGRWGSNKGGIPALLFLVVLIGEMASASAISWIGGNKAQAVPLVLLVLAAWSAQKGASAAARVGCVLFWLVLAVYLVVFGAGLREMEYRWLVSPQKVPDTTALPIFLLPCAACALNKKETAKVQPILPLLLPLFGSVIVSGVLSPQIAENTPNAFYEMSRSLNLFGVAKRFEALVSTASTVGWFALLSYLLSLCGQYSEERIPNSGRKAVLFCAAGAAVWVLCGVHIPGWILVILATVFWVFVPLFVQGIEKRKKSQKREKKG